MTAASIQGSIVTSTDIANGSTKTVDLPPDAAVGELVVVVAGGASWDDSALGSAAIRKSGIFPEGWAVFGTPTADATSAGLLAIREVDGTEDWFGDVSPTIDIGPMTDPDDASAHIAFRALAGSFTVAAATGTSTGPDSPEGSADEVKDGMAVTLFAGSDDVGITTWPYTGNQNTVTATDTAEDAVAAMSTANFAAATINPPAWLTNASVPWVAFTLLLLDIVDADVQGATVQVGVGFGETWAETPYVWTDLTKRVRGIEPERGRQYELDRIEAGTMGVLFDNRDGALNSHNSLSPYAGDLRPTTPIRLRAYYDGAWYPIWQGYVERWPVSFPGGLDSVVSVQAVDLFKLLALHQTNAKTRQTVGDGLAPVGWWRLDEDGATQADHSSGGTHDATLVGTPADEQPGAWGGDLAVSFNGSSQYATVANEATLEILGDTSIEAWFKPTDDTGIGTIIACNGSGSTLLYRLSYWGAQESLLVGPSTSGDDSAGYGEDIAVDTWHHAVVTFDWTATNRTITVYVDGDLVRANTYSYVPTSATRAIEIGRMPSDNDRYFEGSISEVAIYDKVLTATEVANLYNAQRDAYPEAQSGARVETLLDDFGYLPRVVDTGQSLVALRDIGKTSYLDELGVTAETENGVFFIDRAGRAAFHDRDNRSIEESVSSGTFGPNDLTIYDIDLGLDDDLVLNDVRVRPDDDTDPFIATDADSIEAHGRRTFERTVYVADPNEALDAAHWIRAGYSEAKTRIGTLTLRLGKDTALWPVVLGLELGQRLTINKTTEGDDYSDDHYVESISHRITAAKTWEVVLQLSPANQFVVWILGDDNLSILGDTTVLGY